MFSATPPDTLNVTAEWFGEILGMGGNFEPLLVFFAIGGFVGIPVAYILGQFVVKKGVKIPTVVILVIYAIIWLLNGFVNTKPMYAVVTILLVAVSDAVNLVSTQQIMNNWFPKKKGLALGWSTMGMCFSSAIMVLVFQKFHEIIPVFQAPYYLMTVICLILALVTVVWFKNYPEEAGAYPDNEPISEEEREANLKLFSEYKSEFTFKKLMKTKELWALTVLFGFLFLGLVGITSQMIPRMQCVGFTKDDAIAFLMVSSIIGIFGSFAWGWVDQKIGTKLTVEIYCIAWTVMTLVGALGSGMTSKPVTIVSVLMYSLLLGGLGNLMPSLTINIFGRFDFKEANRVMVPLVVAIRSFALLIVPIVMNIVSKGAGIPEVAEGEVNELKATAYLVVFIILAVLSLISTVIAFRTKDKMIGKA